MPAARVPILLYHAISDSPSDDLARWSVTPRAFLSHLDAIIDRGSVTLTISRYVELLATGSPVPERLVLVTFDDGFDEVASFAAPALAERAIAGTVFVTTGSLNEQTRGLVHLPRAKMLEESALVDLEAHGIEIGAHSHTHPQLDVVGEQLALAELARPKEMLEQLLGHGVPSLAYPHGYSNHALRRLAKTVGYESACGVRNAFSTPSDDLFSLSRLMIENTTSHSAIAEWLDHRGAPDGRGRDGSKTHLWRMYRRARYAASAHKTAPRGEIGVG